MNSVCIVSMNSDPNSAQSQVCCVHNAGTLCFVARARLALLKGALRQPSPTPCHDTRNSSFLCRNMGLSRLCHDRGNSVTTGVI